MPDVDSAQFRELCGRFATGVVIITTLDADGSPAGMTANSFASVSLHPPLISINVEHAAEMHRILGGTSNFALNILEAGQEALSRRFAEPHPSRFAGIGHRPGPRGLPLLEGALATLECETVQAVEAGDHTILIARVVGGEVHEGRPLLYYRGGYLGPGLG
jgi:flavin reductase (DIM6/NTAB) family NADH-FMN oxidoreductase RutF